DLYLEKWRLKYVPRIKEEKEKIKLEKTLHEKKLIENENKSISASHQIIDQKVFNELKILREQDEKLKEQLLEIDKKSANVDLTIGLLCNELFALYDYVHDEQPLMLDKYHEEFVKIAKVIAKLIYKGFSIHILRSRPLICQSHLLRMSLENLHINENNQLVILTVVGEQSSAKSSLLNSTFGCNFRVSAGRCTIGMHLGIFLLNYKNSL
ncbi:unnamed protein product, partial [Rotaria sp. Silwood2]